MLRIKWGALSSKGDERANLLDKLENKDEENSKL